MANQIVTYSIPGGKYQGHVRIPDHAMMFRIIRWRGFHNVMDYWKAWGSPRSKSPGDYLFRSAEGRRQLAWLSQKAGVPAEDLWRSGGGDSLWFTHLLAMDYAAWINIDFKNLVYQTATDGLEALLNLADEANQEIYEDGKIKCEEMNEEVHKFPSLVIDGEDKKYPWVGASIGRSVLGVNPSEYRRQKGIPKGQSIWKRVDAKKNIHRNTALVYAKEAIADISRSGGDTPQMLRKTEEVCQAVKDAFRALDKRISEDGTKK